MGVYSLWVFLPLGVYSLWVFLPLGVSSLGCLFPWAFIPLGVYSRRVFYSLGFVRSHLGRVVVLDEDAGEVQPPHRQVRDRPHLRHRLPPAEPKHRKLGRLRRGRRFRVVAAVRRRGVRVVVAVVAAAAAGRARRGRGGAYCELGEEANVRASFLRFFDRSVRPRDTRLRIRMTVVPAASSSSRVRPVGEAPARPRAVRSNRARCNVTMRPWRYGGSGAGDSSSLTAMTMTKGSRHGCARCWSMCCSRPPCATAGSRRQPRGC